MTRPLKGLQHTEKRRKILVKQVKQFKTEHSWVLNCGMPTKGFEMQSENRMEKEVFKKLSQGNWNFKELAGGRRRESPW